MTRDVSQPVASTSKETGIRKVTIVIPAYNEEGGIAQELSSVREAMALSGWQFDVLVVDDGSTDETATRAEAQGATVLRLGTNRGYGAALKAGIALADSDWVVIIDADGTYPSAEIPRMLERVPASDMVVGARIGWKVQDPLVRRPVKWLLRKIAGYLVGREIPDLNSGMRVIRKSLVQEYAHILPSGFSFTTTITLALISNGYSVSYVPIDYFKRIGHSKINASHAVRLAFQMLRTMMLFRPLRVLGPVASIVVLAGLTKLAYDVLHSRLPGIDVMILLQGILIWSVALLADQVARLHQRKR